MPLPPGKVSPYELAELLFPQLEIEDDRVRVGPGVGIDASIVEMDDRVIALSSDPITGTLEDPGWLLVHVNANDVATMGASPEWFLMNLFLPEGSEGPEVREVVERAESACESLGVTLVGGHTEVTPGIGRTLISGAMVGMASKDSWVSAGGARPGDRILFTKSAAVEGTFILASDREEELKEELGNDLVERAKGYREKLSVVREALTAIEAGDVHAMHDPTEGGLLGGLYELADASGVGFSIESAQVPVSEETRAVSDYFGVDPLQTIGSGSLIICVKPSDSEHILDVLQEKGLSAVEIGEILEDEELRTLDGEILEFPGEDEIWSVFEKS